MKNSISRFANVEDVNAKSTVLSSLLWLFALTLTATISSTFTSKDYLTITLLIVLLIELISIISSYYYFAKTNPDQLRSEKYSIHKMAIEKSVVGDTESGFKKLDNSEKVINSNIGKEF